MTGSSTRVFISYSHDSDEHSGRVLTLAQRLRQDGIDAWIDQFENSQPDHGWPRWMEHQISAAKHVLVACTPIYHDRFNHNEASGVGLGVRWESVLLRTALYSDETRSDKFLPILFQGASVEDVPAPLRFHSTSFSMMADYEKLLRLITDQPRAAPTKIGAIPNLPESGPEPVEFTTDLRHRIAELNRQIEQLTKEQYRVIRLLSSTRRVRIAGCAGSGKTLVAVEKCFRLANGGLRVLFLCHSPLLAGHVRSLVRGTRVVVWAFSDWVRRLSESPAAGGDEPWTNYDEPDSDTLEAAFDAISENSEKFDAVIVDEGQDFRNEWWILVEGALADASSGILYIFHDDHQALLPHRGGYPIDDPVLDLSRNCRNSGKIFDLVRYFHAQAPNPDLDERGEVVMVNVAVGEELDGLRQALTVAHRQGHTEGEIVVLLSGGLSVANWSGMGRVLEVSTSASWQQAVMRYFQRAAGTYDRRGVTFPEHATSLIKKELSKLSDEPFPTEADIDRVCDLSRAFPVSSRIRRHVMDIWEPANFLQFRIQNEQLRLRRRRAGAHLAAEIFMHFEKDNWAETLPRPHGIPLLTGERSTAGEGVRVFNLNAFKGLEADTIVLVVGGRRPLRAEETYVGISRARFSLFIVDCQSGLDLPEDLLSQGNRRNQ